MDRVFFFFFFLSPTCMHTHTCIHTQTHTHTHTHTHSLTHSLTHSPATLLGTPVKLLGNNHMPITWQQLNVASRCGEDDLLKFKPSTRMGNKGDLCDFECGIVVGARQSGLSISKTAYLLGFPRTILGFTENGPKKRKCPVSCSFVDEKALLMSEKNGQTG